MIRCLSNCEDHGTKLESWKENLQNRTIKQFTIKTLTKIKKIGQVSGLVGRKKEERKTIVTVTANT